MQPTDTAPPDHAPAVTADDATGADAAAAEFEEAEVREAVESLAPSPLAVTEDQKLLERYLRRRKHLVGDIATVKAQADAMVRSLESDLRGLDYYYGPAVRTIVAGMIEGRKAKSVRTMFGTAGFRTTGGKLTVMDPITAVAHAKELGLADRLRVKEELPTKVAQEYLEQTGEVIGGCIVTPKEETFYAS